MNDFRTNEIVIVEALKNYLSTQTRPCEVVRSNQVSAIPPYPYCSYTVTTPLSMRGGTYAEGEDKTLFKDMEQIWSFTIQSDDQEEAMGLAMKAHGFFGAAGVVCLADHDIIVRRVSSITARDSLLSVQYEYRNGFDVTFGLMYSIRPEEQPYRDEIETADFKEV